MRQISQANLKKKTQKTSSAKKGSALFNDVVKLTGLPGKAMRKELTNILERKNIDVKNLTLEQLRVAAASYLREIMEGLLEQDKGRTRH